MTMRAYLWGMRFCTLVALLCLGSIIYFVNPVREGIFALILFYISLFFSVTGLITLFLFWTRRTFSSQDIALMNVGVSFRQGVLAALAVCALLILQSFRLLVWWDAGIVVAGVLLIELWFLSR